MMKMPSKNQPCYCGSGVKFKKCCMVKIPTNLVTRKAISPRKLTIRAILSRHLYTFLPEEKLPIANNFIPNGIKSYILYRLEQLILSLKEPDKDEQIILSLYNDLYWMFYGEVDKIHEKIMLIKKLNTGQQESDIKEELTESEKQLLLENTIEGGILDFVILPENAILDYDALRRSCELTKKILLKGIPEGEYISKISVYTDTGDIIIDYNLEITNTPVEHIWIDYKPKDVLENEYKILNNTLYSFSTESRKTLATVITEEKTISKKSPELRSYTGLVMNYLGVIEKELKLIIIQKEKLSPNKPLMWRDITNYIKKNDLPIIKRYIPDIVKHMLSLNALRNKAAHGEFISLDEFIYVKEFCFKKKALEYIAWEKSGNEPKIHSIGIEKIIPVHLDNIEIENNQSKNEFTSQTNILEANTNNDSIVNIENITSDEAYKIGEDLYDNQEFDLAFKYLLYAARNGHIRASWKTGLMYDHGQGTKQNYDLAFKWIKKSADNKDSYAQYLLAGVYAAGKGVKRDLEKAISWYKKSAMNNIPNTEAQYQLANCYAKGWGTKKNQQLEIFWYEKAAENGHELAQHNIGTIYLEGIGVSINLDKAYKWLRKAADQGFKPSQQGIDGMIKYLNYQVAKNVRHKENYFKLNR